MLKTIVTLALGYASLFLVIILLAVLFSGLIVWAAASILHAVFDIEVLNITYFESVLVGLALGLIGSFFKG